MNQNRVPYLLSILGIFGSFALVGLTWLNFQFVSTDTGINDFIPAWGGTRWFLLEGWSPYSEQTNLEIHDILYERPASGGEDPGLFLYPLFSTLFFTPFSLIGDPDWARALWMTLIEIILFIGVLICLSVNKWKPSWWLFAILVVFSVIWYPGIRAILDNNPIYLFALFFYLAILEIQREQDALAGFFLVLACSNTDYLILATIFIVFWAISVRRWKLIGSMIGCSTLLIAASCLIIPDWPIQFARQVVHSLKITQEFNFRSTLISLLPGIGIQLGWLITGIFSLVLIFEWKVALGKDTRRFLWAMGLTLAVTPILWFRVSIENYIVLFPALVLVLSIWDQRWGRIGHWLIAGELIALSLVVWGLAILGARQDVSPDRDPWMLFLIPFLLLLGLYWVRWWIVRDSRLPLVPITKNMQ